MVLVLLGAGGCHDVDCLRYFPLKEKHFRLLDGINPRVWNAACVICHIGTPMNHDGVVSILLTYDVGLARLHIIQLSNGGGVNAQLVQERHVFSAFGICAHLTKHGGNSTSSCCTNSLICTLRKTKNQHSVNI